MATSYPDIVKKFKLSEQQLEKECSFEVMLKVHESMTGWRNIGAQLFPLDKATSIIETIDHDLHLDDKGKRFNLLIRWKQFYGSDATFKMLIKAFLCEGREDLAEDICQRLSNGEHSIDMQLTNFNIK